MKKFKIQKSKVKSSAGFTLIETLIYIALIAIIISGSLVAVYQIIETNSDVYDKIILEQEADFLMQKIKWVLTGVSTINTPSVSTTSSVLSVNKTNFLKNPIVIDLNSNNMRIKRGSDEPAILNNQNVTVQNLVFERLPVSGKRPEGIKINLTVNNQSFSTIIYLRK